MNKNFLTAHLSEGHHAGRGSGWMGSRYSATRRGGFHRRESGNRQAIASVIALDIDPNAKLTREQLEDYVWAAPDILQGLIDSSDYENARRIGGGE